MIAAAVAADRDRGGAGRPVLVVTSTFREAEAVTAALNSLVGEDQVAYYPAWETLPHERLSPRSDTVGRRLAVLRRLAAKSDQPPPRIIVAPVRSVLQPQVKGLADLTPVRLAVGDEYDLDQLARDLVNAAYIRVDLVERRGEFAVRGGIVDVFPPTEEHPVRIDFFGDEIEEIRYFTVADQRSSRRHPAPTWWPPRAGSCCSPTPSADRAFDLSQEHPELIEMLDKIAQGHAVDGMEALSPALVDGMELLIDLLPPDTHVLVCDPELVRGRAIDLVKVSEEFLQASWAAAAGGGQAPDRPGRLLLPAAGRRTATRPRSRPGLVDPVTVQCRPRLRRPSTPRRARTDRGRRAGRLLRSGQHRRRRIAHGGRPDRGELSGRHRGGGGRHRRAAQGRLAGRAHRRGARDWRPDGGGAHRARVRRPRGRPSRRGPGRRGWPPSSAPSWSTASWPRASSWPCSPPATSRVSGRPTRRAARCRCGARTRSTRSSWSPATPWCTASTGWVATSR